MSPAGIGRGTPVVPGKLIGSPRRHPRRQEAEALRLQRVAVPAQRLHRIDRHAEPVAQCRHDRRIVPPAAGDQPAQRRRRQRRGGDRGGGERHQRRRAIGRRQVARARSPPATRRSPADPAISAPGGRNTDAPAAGPAPPHPPARTAPARHRGRTRRRCAAPSSRPADHCPARCRTRPASPSAPIQVTLATPPMFSTASGFAQIARQRGMVDRRQRRTLARPPPRRPSGSRTPPARRSAAPVRAASPICQVRRRSG